MSMEKQPYRFIFRFDDGAVRQVKRSVSPGMAEAAARDIAKAAARKMESESAVCVWMGPVGAKIPPRLKQELENE